MYKCPCCGMNSISWWKKLFSTRLAPKLCNSCGGEFYVPINRGWLVYKYLAFPAVVAWILVFTYKSGWPLVILIPALIWSVKYSILDSKLVCGASKP